MNKITKLIIRIFLVLTISFISLIGVKLILRIDSVYKNNEEWNWDEENELLNAMLKDKYPNADSPDYPVLMLRNQKISPKEANEKRILVIGDSYIYNYGGDNLNYTWWKQLNRKIKELGYSNVNVYASGKPFTNTADELEMILNNEQLMKRLDPDLIIVGYVKNDAEQRDKTNTYNLITELGYGPPADNEIYQRDPDLYQKLVQRYSTMEVDYDSLKSMGDMLGQYRYDIWSLMIVEGENLENYKKVLKKFDERMQELDIPYFFYFADSFDGNELVEESYRRVMRAMDELKITYHRFPMSYFDVRDQLPSGLAYENPKINPVDGHPGVAFHYYFATSALDIIKKNYNFVFEDLAYQDINELELNINDTMPFIDVKKIKKNLFEFEYPVKEKLRSTKSKFLFYPIEKEYIKLNLEFPKNIKKIIISGENLISTEVYVNTIPENYDFDIEEIKKEVFKCAKLEENTYEVNEKITSVNIVANFKNQKNRKLNIEFIEE